MPSLSGTILIHCFERCKIFTDPELNPSTYGQYLTRHRQGIYQIDHFNFDFYISVNGGNLQNEDEWTNDYDYTLSFVEALRQMESEIVPFYGVCDSIEQFLSKFGKAIEESKDEYCVSFTKIEKNIPAQEGGWRWHKWGEYVGESLHNVNI